MKTAKKVKYREGDWFGVPLEQGGWAVGIIARRDKRGGVIAYFFGPRRDECPKSTAELDQLHHSQAVWRAIIGLVGLMDGTWPILGRHANWRRELFPNPVFCWFDTGNHAYRIQYDDDDFMEEVRKECSLQEGMSLPRYSFPMSGFIEYELGEVIAGRRRFLGDPRPGTLPWTDQFPPPPDPADPFGHHRHKKAQPEASTSSAKPDSEKSADELALEAMAETSDTSKPHLVDHYLYFKTRADALAAKKDLAKDKSRKYICDPVTKGADGESWLVLAHRIIVPTFEAIEDENTYLSTLAEKYGGDYDGWESGTVPIEKH